MVAQAVDRRKLPIGVFDSGVGGLTVMTVLRTMFPHEDFVYVGDNANNPVGNRSNEEIIELISKQVAIDLELNPEKKESRENIQDHLISKPIYKKS